MVRVFISTMLDVDVRPSVINWLCLCCKLVAPSLFADAGREKATTLAISGTSSRGFSAPLFQGRKLNSNVAQSQLHVVPAKVN